jgi:flavin-dependent dehydrogenase
VFEQVGVRSVALGQAAGPTVHYEDRRDGRREPGSIDCRYVVDASGHGTVLANQLGARRLVGTQGRFLGIWGYYEGASFIGNDQKIYAGGQLSAVKPVTLVCSYQDGWAWHIILRKSTSVGLVLNTDRVRGLSRADQERYFVETCASIPILAELLAPARFIEGSLSFRPDYSYYSEQVVGDDFFCVGDAATFIDPIFSQGVTTGFYNAAVCTWALTSSLKNPARKAFFGELYRRKLMEHYGFYRLLTFGDLDEGGIDPELVRQVILSRPQSELELTLVASGVTARSQNFHEMARKAGLADRLGSDVIERLSRPVPTLLSEIRPVAT